MGYPMTYNRVVRRAGLEIGDYSGVPAPEEMTPKVAWSLITDWEELARGLCAQAQENGHRFERRWHALLGDLRRLEHDTLDEQAIVRNISFKTGVEENSVAAVLREYLRI